jgi:hypothetical protein
MAPPAIDARTAKSVQYQNSERAARPVKSTYFLKPEEIAWPKFMGQLHVGEST